MTKESIHRKNYPVKSSRVALREERALYDDDVKGSADHSIKDKSKPPPIPTPPPPPYKATRYAEQYALAWEQLRMMRFWGMAQFLKKHGPGRVLAAIDYVKVCPGIKNPGANVRLLLESGDPIPLPPPAAPEKPLLSGRYRDKVHR